MPCGSLFRKPNSGIADRTLVQKDSDLPYTLVTLRSQEPEMIFLLSPYAIVVECLTVSPFLEAAHLRGIVS